MTDGRQHSALHLSDRPHFIPDLAVISANLPQRISNVIPVFPSHKTPDLFAE
jgi:hypothetical protein